MKIKLIAENQDDELLIGATERTQNLVHRPEKANSWEVFGESALSSLDIYLSIRRKD